MPGRRRQWRQQQQHRSCREWLKDRESNIEDKPKRMEHDGDFVSLQGSEFRFADFVRSSVIHWQSSCSMHNRLAMQRSKPTQVQIHKTKEDEKNLRFLGQRACGHKLPFLLFLSICFRTVRFVFFSVRASANAFFCVDYFGCWMGLTCSLLFDARALSDCSFINSIYLFIKMVFFIFLLLFCCGYFN